MAEVFQGTPNIVSVTINGEEGRQVTYHIAGRDIGVVKEAVRSALSAIPDEDAEPVKLTKPHEKRKRRTKAELAAAAPKEAEPVPAERETAWPA